MEEPEEPWGARRTQDEPGGATRSQEPGGARRSQEEAGRARWPRRTIWKEHDAAARKMAVGICVCFLGKRLGSFTHVMVPHIWHDDARWLTR